MAKKLATESAWMMDDRSAHPSAAVMVTMMVLQSDVSMADLMVQ